MKMNNKGFTLIELLAVIVILAIIALISTPIIIGVIENARNKAAVNSAYGVIDAAKLAYTESILSSTTSISGNVADLATIQDYASIPSYEGLLTMLCRGMMEHVNKLAIGLNQYAENLEK